MVPDPVSSQTSKSQEVEFLLEKYTFQGGNRSKNILKKVQSPFERQETRFLGKLWSISELLDPDSLH